MNARPSVSRVRMIARPRQTPHRLGRLAERRVLWHFRLRGWRVLARNWRPRAARNRGGELDLVVRRGGCVVFVEIKARSREQDLDSVLAPAQRRSIERAASEFLARAGIEDVSLRFDLVYVAGRRLRHYRDAWRPRD